MTRPRISDLAVGTAGEHLVCSDLLLQGYRAFLSDQNCPYDVAVDVGSRLVKVQVKATLGTRSVPQRVGHQNAYLWHVKRAGKGARRLYGVDEFDIVALVALDVRRIAYLPTAECPVSIIFRSHDDPRPPSRGGKAGRVFADHTFDQALARLLEGGDELDVADRGLERPHHPR